MKLKRSKERNNKETKNGAFYRRGRILAAKILEYDSRARVGTMLRYSKGFVDADAVVLLLKKRRRRIGEMLVGERRRNCFIF